MTHTAPAVRHLIDRLTPALIDVVGEMGRVRGRRDAAVILPSLRDPDRASLHRVATSPGYLPGDLLCALAACGGLAQAQLFAPNGHGYLDTYAAHTLGMLLTRDDHDLLTAYGLDLHRLRNLMMPTVTGILQSAWEDGFGQALLATDQTGLATAGLR